jgi:hypothetical protein
MAGLTRLWRGSNLSSDQGTVGLYRVAGIMSRLPLGGDPDYVRRSGLWEAVGAHVKPQGETEEQFLRSSQFISFTESEPKARHYASQRGAHGLEACSVYDEDAVVFEMDISGCEPLDGPGVFRLYYPCDYSRAIPLHDNADERESLKHIRCEFCRGTSRTHSLTLIDVVRFLQAHTAAATNPCALASATEDLEWLAWPTDFVPRLKGFASMIAPSPLWMPHHFKYTTKR